MPLGGVQIGVAEAAVDRRMAEADIGQAVGFVVADRNVSGSIDHEIMDAVVPFDRRHGIEVAPAAHGVAEASRDAIAPRPRQSRVYADPVAPDDAHHADGKLPAENRRRERIAWDERRQVGVRLEAGDETPAFEVDVPATSDRGMVEDGG